MHPQPEVTSTQCRKRGAYERWIDIICRRRIKTLGTDIENTVRMKVGWTSFVDVVPTTDNDVVPTSSTDIEYRRQVPTSSADVEYRRRVLDVGTRRRNNVIIRRRHNVDK